MALTTYAELQSAIRDRVNNTSSDVVAAIPDFIKIAENDISYWLRAVFNQRRSTTTPDSAYVALPSDFLELVSIQYESGSYRCTLEQKSPHLLDQLSPSTAAGTPRWYAIHDDQIEFRPAFSDSNTAEVEITYYFKPAALSDANTTNELLANIPEILLYRAVAEGMGFMLDDAREMKYIQMYEKVKADFLKQQAKRKWGGSPLRIGVDHQFRM